MLVNVKLSPTEVDKLLKTAIVCIDTREKENKNSHITDYFDKKKIKYKKTKLDYGDYTLMIPAGEIYPKDIYLNNIVAIERKQNLSELANNFTQDRQRILLEFYRKKGKIFLMVENASYGDIDKKKYKSNLNPKSFKGMLKTLEPRFNLSIDFIDQENAGDFIYTTLIYYAREILKTE